MTKKNIVCGAGGTEEGIIRRNTPPQETDTLLRGRNTSFTTALPSSVANQILELEARLETKPEHPNLIT